MQTLGISQILLIFNRGFHNTTPKARNASYYKLSVFVDNGRFKYFTSTSNYSRRTAKQSNVTQRSQIPSEFYFKIKYTLFFMQAHLYDKET